MLNIKILGPGCHYCDAVKELAVAALETLSAEDPNLEATVQHIADLNQIVAYGLLLTPGLVVNEKLVCAGRIPTPPEVIGWLRAAMQDDGGA